MLEKICDKLLIFNNKKIIRYEYGIYEYLNNAEKNKKKDKDKKRKNELEEKIILENKITYILSCLSSCTIRSEEYKKLDDEYNKLISLRKSIKD